MLDRTKARVTDYKSGKMKKVVVRGGAELQRCLYCYAVTTLVGDSIEIETRLLYPREGEKGLLALPDPKAMLDQLTGFLKIARNYLLSGNALPGAGAEDEFNDYAFALPGGAKQRYFAIKAPLIAERLRDLVPLWGLE